jgi:FAD/FMN-containing dehydrogenase
MTTVPTTTALESATQELQASLRGVLLRPGDGEYDEARRVWNGMIDRRPLAIARCESVSEVIASVKVARRYGLRVSVRGGGHGASGQAVAEGGLMIDLSRMKAIRVDPVAQTARVEAGALQGDLDREAQAFGLATTGGEVSHTGVGGLTLGGGVGWLMRKHGYTVDNLLSADIVTADGQMLTANAIEHPNLFWGIRGGGGNFGVVTSFEYQLHRVGPIVLGGMLLYPLAAAEEVLRFYRSFMAAVADELTVRAVFMTAPPAPFIPPHLAGEKLLALPVCYAGPIEEGLRALAPLRTFREPAVDLIGPVPYVEVQRMVDDVLPHGLQYYNRMHYLSGLEDSAISTMVEHFSAVPSPLSMTILFPMGGAVRRFPEDRTAMGNRDADYGLWITPCWTDPGELELHRGWTRAFWEAMQPYATGRTYANALDFDTDDRVRSAFSPRTYERLVALKNAYDPTNFFRLNQNIAPTMGTPMSAQATSVPAS